MRAEEVYNIAINLPEKELDRLYAFIGKKQVAKQKINCKEVKKKLITDKETRKFILRPVLRLVMRVVSFTYGIL